MSSVFLKPVRVFLTAPAQGMIFIDSESVITPTFASVQQGA